jgi:hypothetical protein
MKPLEVKPQGETKEEKQSYHEAKDNHDCFLQDLRKLATQDSPQGRAAAIQLKKHTPLLPTPAANLMGSKPSDNQISG